MNYRSGAVYFFSKFYTIQLMNTQLFIPDKIKVGYQERQDTYTKRLAYVVYYDNKGVLRKENSWRGWIDKGNPTGNYWDTTQRKHIQSPDHIREPLPTHDFDNVPTEGFVLNKKVGGTKYGWNPRATYSRVYDPRGFEFEISIPNLLFILSETNCYKGKGLEGEFVYAWDKKDLILIPVGCNDYKECKKFTTLQSKNITVKDLTPGCSYQTKKQENLIYMGKFPWYQYKWNRSGEGKIIKETKPYIFVQENTKTGSQLIILNELKSLAGKSSDVSVSNFAELMDTVTKNFHFNKPIGFEKISKTLDFEKMEWESFYFEVNETTYRYVSFYPTSSWDYLKKESIIYKYNIGQIDEISLINGEMKKYGISFRTACDNQGKCTKEDILAMNPVDLYVTLANGEKIELSKLF